MEITSAHILDTAEALRQHLVPADLDATLQNITNAAVEVLPGADYASVSIRHPDGTLDSYAVTGKVIVALDDRQYELREGPCYDGATDEAFVASGDLMTDPRYPRYGPTAAKAGIRSQAAVRLFENGKTIGALNIFSEQPGAFSSVETLGRLFTHQAAVALAYSVEVRGLNEAVRSRTRIGQAVGIVMERYKMPEHQAFAFLTRMSQQSNVKLRRIAEELVAAVGR